MTTFCPTSHDELSDVYFAAWFDAWTCLPDAVDPADAFATFCGF